MFYNTKNKSAANEARIIDYSDEYETSSLDESFGGDISGKYITGDARNDIRSTTTVSSGGFFPGFNNMGNIETGATIISLIISLIVAIVLFITIIERKKPLKGRFTNWLREYLNFRSILISGIIKFVYTFLATFTTIIGFVLMFTGREDTIIPMILTGLAVIIFGNILLRILMELTMAMIVVWENTSDIRSVIVKKDEEETSKEEPKEPKPIKGEPKAPEPVKIEEPMVAEPRPVVEPRPINEGPSVTEETIAEQRKIEIK